MKVVIHFTLYQDLNKILKEVIHFKAWPESVTCLKQAKTHRPEGRTHSCCDRVIICQVTSAVTVINPKTVNQSSSAASEGSVMNLFANSAIAHYHTFDGKRTVTSNTKESSGTKKPAVWAGLGA